MSNTERLYRAKTSAAREIDRLVDIAVEQVESRKKLFVGQVGDYNLIHAPDVTGVVKEPIKKRGSYRWVRALRSFLA